MPPTHVFGLAFDIPRGDMPWQRQRRLESYLRQLEAAGKVVYFKEGRSQSTFHVLAVPEAGAEFERDFERFATGAKTAAHGPMLPNCADVREAESLEDTISW